MSSAASVLSLPDIRVAVIGLGYVGLPLAVEFGRRRPTLGFDVDQVRVTELQGGRDSTQEVSTTRFVEASQLTLSADVADLADYNVYIVAVPTPIDRHHQPDLGPLLSASRMVGQVIKRGDIVIYESTVYPGATEEDCLPEIEAISGLQYNHDFFAGYSPERINPGDKTRPLPKIIKVTSGSTPEVADVVDALYRTIITAGTFKAASIKVAETSKVIENVQRDVNIALINELAIIFSHLGIDSADVLDAAATKWNFNRLSPGLVGGHCIGVDPYYLVHKSIAAGHIPDIIRTSREINDGMARFAVNQLLRSMIDHEIQIKNAHVLVLGLAFKENCPDIRNTKVSDLIAGLRDFGMQVEVCDPWVNAAEAMDIMGEEVLSTVPELTGHYDAVVLSVPHEVFVELGSAYLKSLLQSNGVFFDMKSIFPLSESNLRL